MPFVRTTGGLLQLDCKKLTRAHYVDAAAFARDVLKNPALSDRIHAAMRKHAGLKAHVRKRHMAPVQAPVLDDRDAFSPELFR